jgi:hypothetical protein
VLFTSFSLSPMHTDIRVYIHIYVYIRIKTGPVFSFILSEDPYSIPVYSEGKIYFRGLCMDGRKLVMKIFKIYNEGQEIRATGIFSGRQSRQDVKVFRRFGN